MTDSLRTAPRTRATMRDVAARAGVSLKTVSRVLNNEPGVAEATAEKVHRAARELSFQLNFGARSLRRSDGRTATLGVILENVENPYSSAIHRAVEEAARERGLSVLAGSLDEDPRRERALVAAFSSRRVDGLVMMPTGTDHRYLLTERQAGTFMVFVDRSPGLIEADVVVTDNQAAAESGVQHLILRGHRRIAFVGDLLQIQTAQQRYAGYLDAMRGGGLRIVQQDTIHDCTSASLAEAAVTAMMMRHGTPPTALFTAQNFVTFGALRALRHLGMQHRVALVGFDDFALADLLDPGVTVVAQDAAAIGRRAAERLFSRFDGDDSPFTTEVVPSRLVVRGSGEIPPP